MSTRWSRYDRIGVISEINREVYYRKILEVYRWWIALWIKPVEKEFTYDDIVNTYNRSGDKKDVAKRFCISVGEVTKILKKNK